MQNTIRNLECQECLLPDQFQWIGRDALGLNTKQMSCFLPGGQWIRVVSHYRRLWNLERLFLWVWSEHRWHYRWRVWFSSLLWREKDLSEICALLWREKDLSEICHVGIGLSLFKKRRCRIKSSRLDQNLHQLIFLKHVLRTHANTLWLECGGISYA